jgi:hypothetical protein
VRQRRTITYDNPAAAKIFSGVFQLEITRGVDVRREFLRQTRTRSGDRGDVL